MALNMTHPWLKATIISIVFSGVFTLGTSIFFGGGRSFPPEIEWQRVNQMKYQEAQDYLYQRAIAMSGWEALKQGIQSPLYWRQLFYAWLLSFSLAFACCGALVWWLGIKQAPSNSTFERDAPQAGRPHRER
jgi:hypothetical protein